MDTETRALVEQARAGSKAAFGSIVDRFKGRALAIAAALVGGDEAEDAAQEAFIHAYRALSTLREVESFPAWLHGLVMNAARDRLRRRRRERARLGDLLSRGTIDRRREGIAVRGDLESVVEALLDELEPEQRAALALRLYDERSYREIAESLATSEASVRGLLYRGMKRLRERLAPVLKAAP